MARPGPPVRPAVCRFGLCVGLAIPAGLLAGGPTLAFPLADQTTNSPVPTGSELAAPDAQSLRHQLQLINGLFVGTGSGGWIIVPRLDIGEMFTDNALQQNSPRMWDFSTIISPGISVTGDTPRVQLRFDYSPVLSIYARTSSQNSLNHQMTGTGLVTVVPELMFIDIRALAGVQSRYGGSSGLLGNGPYIPTNSSGVLNPSLGLSAQNQMQTSTIGISPYILYRIGDYGTIRAGLSLQASRYSAVSGFGTLPAPTGGFNAQNQMTTEETFRYVSGEFLGRFQNTLDVDITQTMLSAPQGGVTATTGSSYSPRTVISNRLAYAVSHAVTVFASLGYENIKYSGGLTQNIQGMTWNVGTTLNPNPDSQITVSYGFQNDANSFQANGNYAITPRTNVALTYSSQLGTQLQALQQQLNALGYEQNGSLVNSASGAPLAVGNAGLVPQPGLFRTDTLNVSTTTTLDKDQLSLSVSWSQQNSLTGNAFSSSSAATTVTAQWTHELRPDLNLNTYLAYTAQHGGGTTSTTWAGSVSLQYLMTESLTGPLRYSYYSRSTPNTTAFASSGFNTNLLNFYQNLVIIGLSKQF